MNKKKMYSTPQMRLIQLRQQQPLLLISYGGPANANEGQYDPEYFDEP